MIKMSYIQNIPNSDIITLDTATDYKKFAQRMKACINSIKIDVLHDAEGQEDIYVSHVCVHCHTKFDCDLCMYDIYSYMEIVEESEQFKISKETTHKLLINVDHAATMRTRHGVLFFCNTDCMFEYELALSSYAMNNIMCGKPR
jgi:hypothetical protein